MNAHVVIGIDRAGLVGEDGETHHGVFDISFLNSIPNMVISMGKDSEEIRNLLYTAFYKQENPFCIRYERDSIEFTKTDFKEICGYYSTSLSLIKKQAASIERCKFSFFKMELAALSC